MGNAQYHESIYSTTKHGDSFLIAVTGRDEGNPLFPNDVAIQLWAPWLSSNFTLTNNQARQLAGHLLACADANDPPAVVAVAPRPAAVAPVSLYLEPEAA